MLFLKVDCIDATIRSIFSLASSKSELASSFAFVIIHFFADPIDGSDDDTVFQVSDFEPLSHPIAFVAMIIILLFSNTSIKRSCSLIEANFKF